MTASLVRLRSLSEPRPRRGSLNHFHVRAGGPCRQDIPIDNNHAPAAIRIMPARGAIWRPKKVTFSKKMSNESTTIQSRFITPPTNKHNH